MSLPVMFKHLAMSTLVAAQVSLSFPGPSGFDVCKPTDCFDAKCAGTPVEFKGTKLQLSTWDGANYSLVGDIQAYSLVQDDFGIFLHGPLFRPAQRKANDVLPSVFVTGSLTDKIFKFDDFRFSGGDVSANMKTVASSPGPSTMYPIPPAYEGGPERLMVAEGNPFFLNPGNHTASMWRGGVQVIDEEKCTTIFPVNPLMSALGRVVNTVGCHDSGFCFFSVWKFYDDSLPMLLDDCLYWCKVNAINDPTTCIEVGIVEDDQGTPICHVNGKGGVHGFKIGKDDTSKSNVFDIFLLFTGQGTFDKGDSEVYKIQLQVDHLGGLDSKPKFVKTLSKAEWGTDLWKKTVEKPDHDVGVDHAWIDDDGKYVWVGTFRKQNNGVHMLEYDTGKLIHSVRGIADIIPGKYGYTSGLSGIGAYGKPGSYIALATCEEFGQQFLGGHSAFVLLDISKAPGNGSTIIV